MKHDNDEEFCSEPVELEDGEQVVICQQNTGPGNQIGGGEFKNTSRGKRAEEAALEQLELEREAPIATD